MRLLVLNGFDRSGSSMLGGLLAAHPDVAHFFQPFSGTEVHATQYEVWGPEHEAPATERFLRAFLAGRLEAAYVAADWFWRHSTALCPDPARLNVVKDTKLHLKLPWLRARFPHVQVRGIWREPRAILASLVRNGFHESWYGARALADLAPTIEREPVLAPLRPFLTRAADDTTATAVVIAARTLFMAAHLGPREWVVYEQVVADPDAALGTLTRAFGLREFSFRPLAERDYNVSGKPFERVDLWRDVDLGDPALLDAIFAPLHAVDPSQPPRAEAVNARRA